MITMKWTIASMDENIVTFHEDVQKILNKVR